jgi:alkylation response protein AidB-like acyl-CoA dehydrogenase
MTADATAPVDDLAEAELLATVRRFVADRVLPVAEELDASERFPADIYSTMGQMGLFGITVSEGDGGGGGTVRLFAEVMEELSYGYASVADQCGLVELVATLISQLGTQQQKDSYLPGLLAGRLRCSYALTEPEAGSDLGGLGTCAVRTPDGDWLLTGEKIFIHNAPIADFALVLACTDPEKGKHGGISMFLVDVAGTPGLSRAYQEHKMGQRASLVGGLVFDQARVPSTALLGPEGAGFPAVMRALGKGRIGIGALSLGIHRRARDLAAQQARDRVQFGRPIAAFQGVAFAVADIATQYEAARLLVREAATRMDAGDNGASLPSMAKLFASEACVVASGTAVQIFGGSGFIRGYEVERLYRDARVTTIYEGTSEMQRLIIARGLLG